MAGPRYVLFAALVAVLIVALVAAPAFPAGDEPGRVQVSVYILNIGKYSIENGAFSADFYLGFKCPAGDCKDLRFEFMNGKADSMDKMIDKDNETFYRVQASLVTPPDLKKFPLDSQRIEMLIEEKNRDSTEVLFEPDTAESGIDPGIAFTGWKISGWNATTRDHDYPVYGQTYSQYVFSIGLTRIIMSAVMKTFLPVLFILFSASFAFLLDPKDASTRLTVAMSSLVASVMYHISISSQLPPVSYLTFADRFMLVTYVILILTLLNSIALLKVSKEKDDEKTRKFDLATRYVFIFLAPLAYALLFVFFR